MYCLVITLGSSENFSVVDFHTSVRFNEAWDVLPRYK